MTYEMSSFLFYFLYEFLKNISLKDINKTVKLDYDTLKEKVKSKNSEVIQYFPLQIMY